MIGHRQDSRRGFLGKALVAGAVAAAPAVGVVMKVAARPPQEAATGKQRWGMLIDTEKCASGCDACVRACDEEHGIRGHDRPATDARWIRKVVLRDKSTGRRSTLPLMCQHCESPPCVDVCPTGASFRRADGIVLVDKHRCIGCRYCMMACPYKARSFIHEELTDQRPHAPRGKGTVESCTLCVHRVDDDSGRTTACAEACARDGQGAIVFGDLSDPDSRISIERGTAPSNELRADLGLNTGVRYRGL